MANTYKDKPLRLRAQSKWMGYTHRKCAGRGNKMCDYCMRNLTIRNARVNSIETEKLD